MPVSGLEIVIALVIAIGLVGIIIPVLPGAWLILIAVLVWASEMGGRTAWTIAGIAGALVVIGAVLQYAVPGKRLKQAGVATSTLLLAGVLGVVGFFVIPVVGLPLGFVAGIYLVSRHKHGAETAWPHTVQALKAVGLAIAIEFCFALLATITWVVGVVLT